MSQDKAVEQSPEISQVENSVTEEIKEQPVVETPAEEYQPNYKFKVLDQEKEFDEWIRPSVNKETEKSIRELYEKAYGLDHVKSKHQETQAERDRIAKEYSEVAQEIAELAQWRDKDLGVFFERLRVPREKVAQWMLKQLEVEQLPEDQKKVYTELDGLKRKMYELEQANSSLSQARIGEVAQARANELDRVLSTPEISKLVQEFDTRLEKPGSFRDMVIRHGKSEFDFSGGKRDLTAEQAVNEVIRILGLSTQAPSPVARPNESATPKVVTHNKPVVLPNLGNSGASAAAKRPKSIDDLRRLAKEMAG